MPTSAGKVALVTAAGQGIGRAIAKLCARRRAGDRDRQSMRRIQDIKDAKPLSDVRSNDPRCASQALRRIRPSMCCHCAATCIRATCSIARAGLDFSSI